MDNYIYSSNFRQDIVNFINFKNSVGYKMRVSSFYLKSFDKFCITNFPDSSVITEELAMSWATKQENETPTKFEHRICTIREFAKYIISIGKYAYLVPTSFIPRRIKHESYIYSYDELNRFFNTLDNCNYKTRFKTTYLTLPILFKILYCCGLRVSEVLNLKLKDVDLENGILSIHDTKNDNDRLVPMSSELTLLCKEYSKKVHIISTNEDYFFYNKRYNKQFPYQTLEDLFKQILNNSNIKYLGIEKGPRIHDFRHTFPVHCFHKLSSKDNDLTAYQTILKAYMGHATFYETTYYIKLTRIMYFDITQKSINYLNSAIPLIGGGLVEE